MGRKKDLSPREMGQIKVLLENTEISQGQNCYYMSGDSKCSGKYQKEDSERFCSLHSVRGTIEEGR